MGHNMSQGGKIQYVFIMSLSESVGEIIRSGLRLGQVSQLRVALPTADHPSWLENKAVAKCPTNQAPRIDTVVCKATI